MIKVGGKTYIIYSKRRFLLFIITSLLLIFALISGIATAAGLNNVSGMVQPHFTHIEIEPGDTLWDIAGEFMPDDMDRRKAVHILCRINDISASQFYAGQILKIPADWSANKQNLQSLKP